MRRVRIFVLAAAVFALLLLLLSGPGTKNDWWDWRVGLVMYQVAAYLGLASAAVALLLVLLMAHPRHRAYPWVPISAVCLGLLAAAPPMIFKGRASRVPPIHDITTDTQDPPAFATLAAVREQGPNKSAYGGPDVASQQLQAYPDIKPKVLPVPPPEAVQKAIDAARSLGWQIAGSDTAAGRIEATDTTGWFGFKDDIVIRVRPQAQGSRIDVRSASRVGRSDVGKNAERIRDFLDKLG